MLAAAAGASGLVLAESLGLVGAAQPAAAAPAWNHPFTVQGTVSSHFGYRLHPVSGDWKLHAGTDYSPPGEGTAIYSVASGVVAEVRKNIDSWGNWVRVDHGSGYASSYAHMKYAPQVSVNQSIPASTMLGVIGTTGASTGPHLHIEIRVNSQPKDPYDYIHRAPLAGSLPATPTPKNRDPMTDIIYFAGSGATVYTQGLKSPSVAVTPSSMWYQERMGAPLFKLAAGWDQIEYKAFLGARLGMADAGRHVATTAEIAALIDLRGEALTPAANMAPLRT